MAKNVTLGDFKTRVRNRGEFRAGYISDSELNDYVNDSFAKLYDSLAEEDPTRFLSTDDVSVSSGTSAYNLPADFYKLVAVWLLDSSSPTGYKKMQRVQWDEMHEYEYSAPQEDEEARYYLRGTQIHVYPEPGWSGTVRVSYIPAPTVVAVDGTSFDFVNGLGLEYVLLDVLVKCAAKEGSDDQAAIWLAQQQQVYDRLTSTVEMDHSQPKTVANIYRQDRSLGRPRRWR